MLHKWRPPVERVELVVSSARVARRGEGGPVSSARVARRVEGELVLAVSSARVARPVEGELVLAVSSARAERQHLTKVSLRGGRWGPRSAHPSTVPAYWKAI